MASGRARCRIEAPPADPGSPLAFAAQELRRYVAQMSGVTLVTAPAPSGDAAIALRVDPALAAEAAGLDSARAADRYLIAADPSGIQVTGATPRAVLFAVYDLLERLGCGWCVPGDDTVPRRETLALPALRLDTAPVFRYRMMLDFPLMTVAQSIAIADWLAKNRMNWIHPAANAHGEPKDWYTRRDRVVPEIRKRGLHVIFGGHTMHTWISEEYAKEHPDWFALNDGERKPPTLCVSNGQMTAELIKNMQRFLDRCPEVEVVDLWHPDGQVFCHCAVCTRGLSKGTVPFSAGGSRPASPAPGEKEDNPSANGEGAKKGTVPADAVQSAYVITYIDFMNRVAAAIGKSHPQVLVSPLIYGPSDRAMPDGCPAPADNLLLGLAHIFRDSFRPLAGEPKSAMNMRFLGNDLTWMARCRNHYIYEYYNGWAAPFIYPGAQVIVCDLQILRQVGCQGTSSDTWGYSPINMYVAARALWSPEVSWEAGVRDFNLRYYGEVGREMADNWIALEKGIYGLAGYQSNGALPDYWKWIDPACGQWLSRQRAGQIAFLEQMMAKAREKQTKVRLERALQPWKTWSGEARWWALPPFPSDSQPAP